MSVFMFFFFCLLPHFSTNLEAYQKVIFVNKSIKKLLLWRIYRVINGLTDCPLCLVYLVLRGGRSNIYFFWCGLCTIMSDDGEINIYFSLLKFNETQNKMISKVKFLFRK